MVTIGLSQEETRLSGTLVGANRAALKRLIGGHAYERALESSGPELRIELTQATALMWVPIPDMERLVLACAEAAGRDPYDLNLAMTREGTEQSFRTVWRLLLRVATTGLILSRTVKAYDRAYDRGRLEVSLDPDGANGSCEIHGRPRMSRMTREAFGVGVEAVLRLGGHGDARVLGRATDDGASYTIRIR